MLLVKTQMQMFQVLPFKGVVAKSCFRVVDVADKVLGVNLATTFRKRKDFSSDCEYKDYLIKSIQPNMLVVCNSKSASTVNEGTLGRVITCDLTGPVVKWTNGNTVKVAFVDLDILTPPINIVPLAEIL